MCVCRCCARTVLTTINRGSSPDSSGLLFAVGAKTLQERHLDIHTLFLLFLLVLGLVSVFGQRWTPDRLLTLVTHRLPDDLLCLLCPARPPRPQASHRSPQLRMVAELQVGADRWESLLRIPDSQRQAEATARHLPEDALRHILLPDVMAKEPGAENTRGMRLASQQQQASMKTKSVTG